MEYLDGCLWGRCFGIRGIFWKNEGAGRL